VKRGSGLGHTKGRLTPELARRRHRLFHFFIILTGKQDNRNEGQLGLPPAIFRGKAVRGGDIISRHMVLLVGG